MQEMYISINEKYFDEHRKEAKEADKANWDDDSLSLLWENMSTEIESQEIEDNQITLSLNNDLGYFSIAIPLSDDNLIDLVEYAVKRLNKLKTIIEASK